MLKRSGILLLAALLMLGVLEIADRIRYERWRRAFDAKGTLGRLTIASPDSILIWEYRPFGSRPDKPGVTTNRYGFCERDLETKSKPDSICRIAFVGDSVTLGLWVAMEKTFSRRFEQAAAQLSPAREVQTLNFGVDGYNTPQVLELLRVKALEFEPDAVVYTLCLNDFDFEDSSAEKIRYFRKPRSFVVQRLEKLVRLATRAEYYHLHYQRNRDVVFRDIIAMRDLLRERGVYFFVAIAPVFPFTRTGEMTFHAYPFLDLHEALRQFLSASAIPFADLLTAFQEERDSAKPLAIDTWHPTAEGHRVIARALVGPVMEGLGSMSAACRPAAPVR